MTATINPDTYRVLLEALTKAPCATTYKCYVTKILDGGPRHGEFYETFEELPWDGEDGDIIDATWVVPAEYSFYRGSGVYDGLVSVSLTHDGGIYVTNPYGLHTSHAVGREGVMEGNRPGLNLHDPRILLRHTVDTDEAMVAKILELLTAGGWQDAERVIAERRAEEYLYD